MGREVMLEALAATEVAMKVPAKGVVTGAWVEGVRVVMEEVVKASEAKAGKKGWEVAAKVRGESVARQQAVLAVEANSEMMEVAERGKAGVAMGTEVETARGKLVGVGRAGEETAKAVVVVRAAEAMVKAVVEERGEGETGKAVTKTMEEMVMDGQATERVKVTEGEWEYLLASQAGAERMGLEVMVELTVAVMGRVMEGSTAVVEADLAKAVAVMAMEGSAKAEDTGVVVGLERVEVGARQVEAEVRALGVKAAAMEAAVKDWVAMVMAAEGELVMWAGSGKEEEEPAEAKEMGEAELGQVEVLKAIRVGTETEGEVKEKVMGVEAGMVMGAGRGGGGAEPVEAKGTGEAELGQAGVVKVIRVGMVTEVVVKGKVMAVEVELVMGAARGWVGEEPVEAGKDAVEAGKVSGEVGMG
ncbi:hypothetical protein AB1Y20_018052 [Prymnesium parvum]|uniref:Uncharacterized protein n=1 Tax=Prymnesium parvum TaxID=97485 RepID=A0AB34JP88_PRYPA